VAGTAFMLVFLGVFIAFCIGLMVVTHESLTSAGDFMSP
jgi:hypothetical protein